MKEPATHRRLSDEETYSRLRVFRLPPDGFDPVKATKRQLTAYGLPHPPDRKRQPRLAALWRRYMADRPEYVVPEFRIDHSFVPMGGFLGEHGYEGRPPQDHPLFSFDKRFVSRPSDADVLVSIRRLSAQSSNIWSGAYANQPPTEPYNNIFATFNVPFAQPPPSAWNGTTWNDGMYQAVTWVGLDGWNGPDVMQAGVLSRVTVNKGSLSPTYYAWAEFFPTPWITVPNFSVSPGDLIALNVCAPFTTTHAAAIFANKTTGQSTTFGFDAPAGTALTGAVAEWVVEFPGTSPAGDFANYGNATFDNCIAGSKTQERDLSSATQINMVRGGKVVSRGFIQSPSELLCMYQP